MLNLLTNNPFSFFLDPFNLLRDWSAYWADATRKTEVLIKEQQKQSAQALSITGVTNEQYLANHPLAENFNVKVLAHGKDLLRPIGYVLLKISTKPGYAFDPKIIAATKNQTVIDTPIAFIPPRAGKDSSVLGLNRISQLSVALATRSAVYVIDYLPWPDKSQTLDSVCDGVATFLEKICALHPESKEGFDIGLDCQAGWMYHLLLLLHGDRFKCNTEMPIGAPKSFLSGNRLKKNRAMLRFFGLSGKRVVEILAAMDHGFINGRWLTRNFEELDSLSTKSGELKLWEEAHDKEFMDKNTRFQSWWHSGSYYTKAEFLQILELFGEDKFRKGTFKLDGVELKPKKGRATRIILCSEGDTVVPPEQVFTNILKDYTSLDEFKKTGQVRCIHVLKEDGHLSIFLSSRVVLETHLPIYNAMKEASELPSGVYEIKISDGRVTFHERDFSFIESLVKDSDGDRDSIAKVAAMNKPIDNWCSTFLSPFIGFGASLVPREILSWANPATIKHLLLSKQNPAMQGFAGWLEAMITFLPPLPKVVTKDNFFKILEGNLFESLRLSYEQEENLKNSVLRNAFESFATC